MNLLLGIFDHFKLKRKLQFAIIVLFMIASGLAEMISLASSVPFLAVLSDPQQLLQYSFTHYLISVLGIGNSNDLLPLVSFMFILAVVFAALIRLLNLWLGGQFAAGVGSDLSCDAYRRTMYQPYQVHISRNSSEVITTITQHISEVVLIVNAFMQMLTSAVVGFAILIALFLIDKSIALIAIVVFCSAYFVLSTLTRKYLYRNSKKIALANQNQLKALQEGLGAIRDVLLGRKQNIYVDIYESADRPLRMMMAQNRFLASSPRYVIEALGLILIASIAIVLSFQKNSNSIIPLLGSLAIGSQRLLPALQQIYSSWSLITSFQSGATLVLKLLDQPLPALELPINDSAVSNWSEISMSNVDFRYSSDQELVLHDISLNIKRGECVGLVGSTGSGKSTLVDLLIGLLQPTLGDISVDGKKINDLENALTLTAWRSAIAHVPQGIFLADSSISENIAFGVPKHLIDIDRVRMVIKQAKLESLVESSPLGLNSIVGERGVNLSGGQRQRIGIARALYKNASLIVLDEATSALDSHTESEIINTIHDLTPSVTVLMIAPRLTTLARCDRIIQMNSRSSISIIPTSDFFSFN